MIYTGFSDPAKSEKNMLTWWPIEGEAAPKRRKISKAKIIKWNEAAAKLINIKRT